MIIKILINFNNYTSYTTGAGGVASMLGGRSVTDNSRAASSEPRGASSDLDTEATHKIEKSGSAAGGVNGLGGWLDVRGPCGHLPSVS